MAKDEEKLLEGQLELQLQEQKESLSAIKEALVSDQNNIELLAVHDELVSSIRDAEEALLHLKRGRLLQQADSALQFFKPHVGDVEVESLDPTDFGVEPLEEQKFSVGSKCRFCYIDGRWYDGQVIELEGPYSAKVSFLTPTSERMLICKFFLQQRCRFGANCRLSHGVGIPLSNLKRYVPTVCQPPLVGSSIWAVSRNKSGIWREAELESWDDKLNEGRVVFRDDGSSENLGVEAIALSEYAQVSDEESDSTDSTDFEEDSPRGLGFVESTALQRGIQTETTIFAKWESHTRGIASKMMANMGYREGMGLGVYGQGMVDPISVKVLPAKQSLDHALQCSQKEGEEKLSKKKHGRGGKRKRGKKFAEAARAANEEEELRPDVFSLINNQLAMHAESIGGGLVKKNVEEKKDDRRSLIAWEDEVKVLRIRVEKLEEMVDRNKKEKAVYDSAMRKLIETRKALAEAEAAHASASHALVNKDKEKRWLKF